IGIVGIHIQYSCSCVWVSRWCQVWTFRFGHSHLGIHVQYSHSGMCVFMYSGSVVRFVYSFMFDNQVQWLGLCIHLCSMIRFSIHIQVCVCSSQWSGLSIHLCLVVPHSPTSQVQYSGLVIQVWLKPTEPE